MLPNSFLFGFSTRDTLDIQFAYLAVITVSTTLSEIHLLKVAMLIVLMEINLI